MSSDGSAETAQACLNVHLAHMQQIPIYQELADYLWKKYRQITNACNNNIMTITNDLQTISARHGKAKTICDWNIFEQRVHRTALAFIRSARVFNARTNHM